MEIAIAYTVAGVLLIATAALASRIQALPFTTTMVYLLVGVILGPVVTGFVHIDPIERSKVLELVAEVGVLVSLFSAGLKIRVSLRWRNWAVPFRLAFTSMVITVGLIALLGVSLLGLPLGAAVLLGAILAPTDPVLASEIQLAHARDKDNLRFNVTAEAGLNDGMAFPFVMLGLGLLGLHSIGESGWRWIAIDVLWAVPVGLAVGALLGGVVGKLVLYLRRTHQEALGRDEFVALGLLLSAYGVALLVHSYGFLAAFSAGVAIRTMERRSLGDEPPPDLAVAQLSGTHEEIATHEKVAPAYMAAAVLQFNEQIERLMEVLLVMIVGVAATRGFASWDAALFVALLFFVIRPLAVYLGLFRSATSKSRRGLIAWFGIRGIGSIYYLMYALNHGLAGPMARHLVDITLLTIICSIVLHGVTITPLMRFYEKREAQGKSPELPN